MAVCWKFLLLNWRWFLLNNRKDEMSTATEDKQEQDEDATADIQEENNQEDSDKSTILYDLCWLASLFSCKIVENVKCL